MRMKLDFNNLMRLIDDYFSDTRTDGNEVNVAGICFGLELVQSYLRLIAERAIVLDDDELIKLLVDMGILKYTEDNADGNKQ